MFDKNANYIHKCTYRYMANTKYKSVIVSSDFWNLVFFFFEDLKLYLFFPNIKWENNSVMTMLHSWEKEINQFSRCSSWVDIIQDTSSREMHSSYCIILFLKLFNDSTQCIALVLLIWLLLQKCNAKLIKRKVDFK